MAKIAVEIERHIAQRATSVNPAGAPECRSLAQGNGWSADHIVCNSGRYDRPFQEQHSHFSIAIVLSGTFQYRASQGCRTGELMTPGSLLLGNAGQSFECGHEHGTGDRCLSFHFSPEYFDRIAADAGAGRGQRVFRMLRLPALRDLSPLIARACAALTVSAGKPGDLLSRLSWEEFGIQLAACTVLLANGTRAQMQDPQPSAVARVTRAVRIIEESDESQPTVQRLALEAGLSPYHFLRTFTQLTGITPHQYVRRTRLREAAMRLSTGRAKVLDVALDCGFGDMSNFNRAFRNEFGLSPQGFRRQTLQFGT